MKEKSFHLFVILSLILIVALLSLRGKTAKKVKVGEEFLFEVGDAIKLKVEGQGDVMLKRTGDKELSLRHPPGCLCITCSEMGKNFHPEIPFEPKEGNGLIILLFPNESRRIVLRCISPEKSLFKIVVQDSK